MLKMESKFIGHEQCPKCGSKNNLARYSDGAHCFTPDCGYFEKGEGVEVTPITNNVNSYSDLYVGDKTELKDRNISQETASKYGVTKIFTNLKEMAVSQEIDAVYIGYSQFISRRTSYFIFAKWQTCVM